MAKTVQEMDSLQALRLARRVSVLKSTDAPVGPEMNQVWFFLRNRSPFLLQRERPEIYQILDALGVNDAIRITSYMSSHADTPVGTAFWESAHQHFIGERTVK